MSYKTWEMVKMLSENHNLVFRNSIKGYKVSLGESGKILSHEDSFIKAATIHIFYEDQGETEWELVETPVTFLEAVEAFRNGKKIYCKYNNKKSIYDGSKEFFLIDTCGSSISPGEILSGEWYIQEGNE